MANCQINMESRHCVSCTTTTTGHDGGSWNLGYCVSVLLPPFHVAICSRQRYVICKCFEERYHMFIPRIGYDDFIVQINIFEKCGDNYSI